MWDVIKKMIIMCKLCTEIYKSQLNDFSCLGRAQEIECIEIKSHVTCRPHFPHPNSLYFLSHISTNNSVFVLVNFAIKQLNSTLLRHLTNEPIATLVTLFELRTFRQACL